MQHFNKIFKDLSQQRMMTYKNFLHLELSITYTDEQVYNLYLWNEIISSCFWNVVSRIEITLRNHINDTLREKVDKEWLQIDKMNTTKVYFQPFHKTQINKAKNKLLEKSTKINITNDRLVAELNMGFWTSFSEISFSYTAEELKQKEIGWEYFISKIFVGYTYSKVDIDKVRYWKKQEKIDNLVTKLNMAKEIRNRIAHHEPIFNYIPEYLSEIPVDKQGNFLIRLQRTYQHLLQIFHFLSPEQANLHQRNYNHYYTQYLLTSSGFENYLNVDTNGEIMKLDRFVEYMMECMDKEKEKKLQIIHISSDSSYFGCFIPTMIK